MKHLTLVVAILIAATLATTQSAFAARIYNFLPTKVYATGMLGGLNIHQVTLSAGERSESIGWSTAHIVRVDYFGHYTANNRPLCQLNFGIHAEIQGGNYMTIGVHQGHVVCTVCGSSHNVMNQETGISTHWADSRTGC